MRNCRGSLRGMTAVDAVFRWAIGLSLLVHGVAFGSMWGTMGRYPRTAPMHLPQDSWVGTTVSVYEELHGESVPESQDSQSSKGLMQDPSSDKATVRHVAALKTPKPALQAAASARVSNTADAESSTAAKPSGDEVPKPASGNAGSVDLKQALLDASNQKSNGAGTFGAVGVNLRERRLPAAFTRALPVAIGAETGWWRQHSGSLGKVRFEVALNDAGKIEEVSVDDEARYAFLAGIVRRVGRLLSVGRYALPVTTTPNARQRFELSLDLQDVTPSSNETAQAGDAVDMGWEAPTPGAPGKAHIQEARGRRMLATLRMLPPVREPTDRDGAPSE